MPQGLAFFHARIKSESTQVDTLHRSGAGTMSGLKRTPVRPLQDLFHMASFSTSLRQVLGLIGLVAAAQSALAGSTNVGVSLSVSQPGFYGRVDIGDQQPPLIYPQPVIIEQAPIAAHRRPIYLHVPPGHSRDWARYCGQYRACGQPVYFVREDYYRHNDRDAHRAWDREDHGRHERDDRGDRRDERRGYDRDERGDERGHGRGRD